MRHATRPGFSLTEILITVILLSTVLSFVQFRSRTLPESTVHDAAEQMASEFDRAIAEAIASGGQAVISLDGAQEEWGAWRTDSEDVTYTPPDGAMQEIGDDMIFGTGSATYGPMGDLVTESPGGRPFTTIVCDAWGRCDFGGPVSVTIYVENRRDPELLGAITLTHNGNAESWLYDRDTGGWQ